jgi:hypothetical protein
MLTGLRMSDGYIDAAPGEEPEERGSFFHFHFYI